MINILITVIKAIWFILPAYFANASPVVLGGGTPIDGGKKLPDGQRILGDGKTIRGFIGGLMVGASIGVLQDVSPEIAEMVGGKTLGILHGNWTLGFLLALGALLGDLAASFIKRRAKLRRGQPAPVLDQLDFVFGALLLGSLIMIPSWEIIVAILIVTPSIHLGLNFGAYKLGYKSEPY